MTDHDIAVECVDRLLGYFESYRLAAVAPLIAEIEGVIRDVRDSERERAEDGRP